MKSSFVVLLAVAVAAVTACSTERPLDSAAVPPSGSVFFPDHGRLSSVPDARLTGRLTLEGGCLWLDEPRGIRYLVLWPSEYRLSLEGGTFGIRGPTGSFGMGSTLILGGGTCQAR